MKSITKNKILLIIFVCIVAISSIYNINNFYDNISTEEVNSKNDTTAGIKHLRGSGGSIIVCSADYTQNSPEICSDGAGGAIITWEDSRDGASDIYAQKVDAAGNINWAYNGVPICTEVGFQEDPKICSDGAGGAIIVWEDGRNSPSDNNIYAQRIDSTGNVLWDGNGTSICTYSGDQYDPEICSDGAGGAIIIWEDQRTGGMYGAIYAQRINSTGYVNWTVDGEVVFTGVRLTMLGYSMCSDGVGGAIISYSDYELTDIFAQRINSTGDILWTPGGVTISDANNYQQFPKICSDEAEGAIIVWNDDRGGSSFDIYAQRVNSNGVRQWTPSNGIAICTAANDQTLDDICSNGIGSFIIVWRDLRTLANDLDVYIQLIDINGIKKWTPGDGVPICTELGDQGGSQICNDTQGNVIITWSDFRSGSYSDIYAQRINSTGNVLWSTNGIPISTGSYHQWRGHICSDGGNGAIITWEDLRSGVDYDIYAEKVNSAGELQWISRGGIGGGGGDDNDDDKEGEAIPGYDLYLVITFIGIITIVLIKKRQKYLN